MDAQPVPFAQPYRYKSSKWRLYLLGVSKPLYEDIQIDLVYWKILFKAPKSKYAWHRVRLKGLEDILLQKDIG